MLQKWECQHHVVGSLLGSIHTILKAYNEYIKSNHNYSVINHNN